MRSKDDKKRAAIREATIHEVVHVGLHLCSMPRIARRAGVSVGTIYNYFADKSALFEDLFDEIRAEIDAALVASVPELDSRALRLTWFALLDYLSTHQDEFRFVEIMKGAGVLPEQDPGSSRQGHTLHVLQHAIDSGWLREELGQAQLATLLFAPLRALALSPRDSWTPEDAAQIWAALERGIT